MTEENILTRTLGLIIANRISVNYNYHAEQDFKIAKLNYIANLCKKAGDAELKVINKLKVANKEINDMIDERADNYSDLITDIIELDEKDQLRIKNLILKIKKDKKNGN